MCTPSTAATDDRLSIRSDMQVRDRVPVACGEIGAVRSYRFAARECSASIEMIGGQRPEKVSTQSLPTSSASASVMEFDGTSTGRSQRQREQQRARIVHFLVRQYDQFGGSHLSDQHVILNELEPHTDAVVDRLGECHDRCRHFARIRLADDAKRNVVVGDCSERRNEGIDALVGPNCAEEEQAPRHLFGNGSVRRTSRDNARGGWYESAPRWAKRSRDSSESRATSTDRTVAEPRR